MGGVVIVTLYRMKAGLRAFLGFIVICSGCSEEANREESSNDYADIENNEIEGDYCSEEFLMSTDWEQAMTPRENRDAELLALCMGDGIVAEQEDYERVVADLHGIYSVRPDLRNIDYHRVHDGSTLTLDLEDEETYQAMVRFG